MKVEFTLNGVPQVVTARPGESLLDVLRLHCGIRSLKRGCGQGQCGACLALLDGDPVTTCVLPAARAAGKSVLTLEGLSREERDLISRSFVAAAGLQCGYCTPGIALRAKHLLDRNPSPTEAEIRRALQGHLCRCTGYAKIVAAIDLLARARRGEADPRPETDGRLGKRLARFDGAAAALGEQRTLDDIEKPGMLHGALVFSEHARARVLRIDTSRARAHPGVVDVVTAQDVPGERWYGLLLPDWPGFVAEGEEVRCVGDVLAAVAATDEFTARQAARLVAVEYEPLPPVTDPAVAITSRSARVNPAHDNTLSHTVLRRGDAEAALARSAHVARGTWKTQRVEHLFLEPERALAEPGPEGDLHLYTQGQGIFDDRRQVARFLGMAENRVTVELVPTGGAFGGKEDLSIQAHAALLARRTGRPVRVALNRRESIRLHPKRHPLTMDFALGCDAQGRLTALRARILGDSGAYASTGAKVLERAATHAGGPYRIPDVDIEAIAAYTNNPPAGAMRGFGANQVHFALEGCLDLLAEKAGLDRWEIRWRNAVEAGDALANGQILAASVGIKKTLAAVKDAYDAALARGSAVGIACGLKSNGLGHGIVEWGKARLAVEGDGTILLRTGFSEMGQGHFTALVQFAVESTGLPAELFRPRADTVEEIGCGQTTGSRATIFGGRAVRAAGEKLRAELEAGRTLADLAGRVFEGEVCCDDTVSLEAPAGGGRKLHPTYGFATQVCALDERGRLDRVVAAHDVGKVVNPSLCEGQVEGGVHMGLGYALSEELACREGRPRSYLVRDLGVLRACDMPAVEVILVEDPEPTGPSGAKGIGEIGLVPTAAAVAGALAAYDGIRRTELPMRDSPAARALSVHRAARRAATVNGE